MKSLSLSLSLALVYMIKLARLKDLKGKSIESVYFHHAKEGEFSRRIFQQNLFTLVTLEG